MLPLRVTRTKQGAVKAMAFIGSADPKGLFTKFQGTSNLSEFRQVKTQPTMKNYSLIIIAVLIFALGLFAGKGCSNTQEIDEPAEGKVVERTVQTKIVYDTIVKEVPKLVPRLVYSKPIRLPGKRVHDTIIQADSAAFVKQYLTERVFHTPYRDSLLQLDTYDTLRFCNLVGRKLTYKLFSKSSVVTITEKVKVPPSGSLHAGLLLHLMPIGKSGMSPYLLYQSKHRASFLAGYDITYKAPVIGISLQLK